jgi:hypothetical protein
VNASIYYLHIICYLIKGSESFSDEALHELPIHSAWTKALEEKLPGPSFNCDPEKGSFNVI